MKYKITLKISSIWLSDIEEILSLCSRVGGYINSCVSLPLVKKISLPGNDLDGSFLGRWESAVITSKGVCCIRPKKKWICFTSQMEGKRWWLLLSMRKEDREDKKINQFWDCSTRPCPGNLNEVCILKYALRGLRYLKNSKWLNETLVSIRAEKKTDMKKQKPRE